jgi:NAD(P)-dependent dehydrogenase (short-subunit alcohol dehydrogenase family)
MALNPRIASWQGQRVWVIGASYGIGAAIARRHRDAGAIVDQSARWSKCSM